MGLVPFVRAGYGITGGSPRCGPAQDTPQDRIHSRIGHTAGQDTQRDRIRSRDKTAGQDTHTLGQATHREDRTV
jgi:hypothetical protein